MGQIHTEYDVGLVCLNGHIVNSRFRSNPGENAKFCDKCGEPTIDACVSCHTVIRGYQSSYGPFGSVGCSMTLPLHCHECGKPMPWTQRNTETLLDAIEWLDDLTDRDKDKLRDYVPDVIKETPRTDTAIASFKKAIGKAGVIGGKLLAAPQIV